MDTRQLLGLLRLLRLDTDTGSSLASILGRVGARGVVAMARAYLGPEAYEVEARWCRERGLSPCERVGVPDPEPPPHEPPSDEPPRPTDPPGTGNGDPPRTGTEALTGAEIAIIGMAINKLVYEAGELALHNPSVASDGRLPEFKLDAHGCPPAISLSHIVAATRVLRGPVAGETGEPVTAPTRARLQAARAERYAGAANRFTYLTSTGNRLR
jgi:hypothetical protein